MSAPEKLPVPCPCCLGTGVVDFAKVNPAHFATLMLLRRSPQPISTVALFAIKDRSNEYTKITGICNRLAVLEKLGFVTHERRGKAKFWRSTP